MIDVGGKGSEGVDRWIEALAWYSKMSAGNEKGPNSLANRDWLVWSADIHNRLVFDHVSRLLANRGAYWKRARPSIGKLDQDRYDLSVPIAEWRKTQARRKAAEKPRASHRWLLWPLGIGLAAITVLFALSPLPFLSGVDPANYVTYRTGVGRLEAVHLPDGSSMILGGRTRISVAFSPRIRSVSLFNGQVWFTIAHKPDWPFVVSAGSGTITDVGTAFIVTRESDRVVVTVTQGKVEVAAHPSRGSRFKLRQGVVATPNPTTIRLSRGEKIAYGDNGFLSNVRKTSVQGATAWTRGRLIFDDEPLRYVLEIVNQYSSRPILVEPSAGALRVSGIVYENEIAQWVKGLQVVFPVALEEHGDALRIRMRHVAPSHGKLPRSSQPY